MYDNSKILALILARGGSKGVPRKNVKMMAGKPLIVYTIEAAKKSRYLDNAVVSTEDSEIADVSIKHGASVPFLRPSVLAGDEVASIDVVIDCVNKLSSYDTIVLLQPTSPFRTSADIDMAIEKHFEFDRAPCVSVTESKKHPAWCYSINSDTQCLDPYEKKGHRAHQRQQLTKLYELNGAIYVANKTSLMETKNFLGATAVAHQMEHERSLDIDTPFDFRLAELLMKDLIENTEEETNDSKT